MQGKDVFGKLCTQSLPLHKGAFVQYLMKSVLSTAPGGDRVAPRTLTDRSSPAESKRADPKRVCSFCERATKKIFMLYLWEDLNLYRNCTTLILAYNHILNGSSSGSVVSTIVAFFNSKYLGYMLVMTPSFFLHSITLNPRLASSVLEAAFNLTLGAAMQIIFLQYLPPLSFRRYALIESCV